MIKTFSHEKKPRDLPLLLLLFVVPVLPRTTIVGANGCGGAAVAIFEIVDVGKRDVEIVDGGLRDGVVFAVVEADVGPRVRVNCVAGTGDVGFSGGCDGGDSSV